MGLDMFLYKKSKDKPLDEIAYWRKANAIHKWFVDNVQNGVDDCSLYEVSKDDLLQLLSICKTIDAECIKSSNDMYHIVNEGTARRLLPTCGGFFFGSTEYDGSYARNVVQTIATLEEFVDTFDFKNDKLYYNSWW